MTDDKEEFERLLQKAAELRGHMCSGLTLGLKMAKLGLKLLDMSDPEKREQLVVFVENDKCPVDAIQVATGCSAGSRRLKMVNYGKSAASFVNRSTGEGYRVAEKKDLTSRAIDLAVKDHIIAPNEKVAEFSKLERQIMMNAFAKLPTEELFDYYPIKVTGEVPLVSPKTEPRRTCSKCGEEIRGGLAVKQNKEVYCKGCANGSYYQTL